MPAVLLFCFPPAIFAVYVFALHLPSLDFSFHLEVCNYTVTVQDPWDQCFSQSKVAQLYHLVYSCFNNPLKGQC